MADSVTITPRKLYMEDLGTNTTTAQVTETVLGLGAIPLTAFVAAAGDAAASSAGVLVGEVYMNTAVTPNRLRTRMS